MCCIYMQGDIEDPNDLINLILMASQSSIFFSHRIWFFFQSLQFTNDAIGIKHKDRAQLILTQLKKICIESQELLCLVNSSDLIHFIIKFGMLKHYPEFIKHFEDVLQNYDKKGGLRKFIEEIADTRVN